MGKGNFRWLLDFDLPASRSNALDALHTLKLFRRPGHSGIRESTALDRCLVTLDQEFRGVWALDGSHGGIVILEIAPIDHHEVERILSMLEFRLTQYGYTELWGLRYVVRNDQTVAEIKSDGTEVELSPWKLAQNLITEEHGLPNSA